MKLGVYTAVLHDLLLPHTLDVVASLCLTAANINASHRVCAPRLPQQRCGATVNLMNDVQAGFATCRPAPAGEAAADPAGLVALRP
jgi:hypothetical protein